MKVVIYGASVTAQKDQSGFFEHLISKGSHIDFVRIPFGASHLHYAGIAMIQKVLNEQPDICVLDWVTPSTKVFPEDTVARLNRILLRNKITPLWVLFPRQDDPECKRECCQQIIATESETVFVRKFTESLHFKDVSCNEILRDIVHTNEYGANLYSNFIMDSIEKLLQKKLTLNENIAGDLVPQIFPIHKTLSLNSPLKWKVNTKQHTDIKIFLHAQIGPRSPLIKIDLFDEKGKCIHNAEKNTVDPWCYYERNMLIDLPTIANVRLGSYSLEIRITEKDPFESITTLKPINEEDQIAHHDRSLTIHEMSIDADAEVYL